MKSLNLIILVTACLVIVSCSKDTDESIEVNSTLIDLNDNPISGQLPNDKYDHSEKGLYHGIIASGTNESRGKIWVNLNNDGQYNAYVEMVDGQNFSYKLANGQTDLQSHLFTFKADNASFTIDVLDYYNPIFTEVIINSQPYFAAALKGTNNRMPISYTGIFRETVVGSPFAGTWNLISTGVLAPEGFGYETISMAVVTFYGTMFTDSTFELFNYPCISNPAFNPQMGTIGGNANAVLAHDQTSNFNGTTSWDLGTANGDYYNSACAIVPFGTFSWTSAATGITKNGFVRIDP